MSLTDVMSHLDLAVYPMVGLVLFFAVFVAVSWRALRRPHAEVVRNARLVLDDIPARREGGN